MRGAWTACGACTSGSTGRRRGATRPGCGSAAATNTTATDAALSHPDDTDHLGMENAYVLVLSRFGELERVRPGRERAPFLPEDAGVRFAAGVFRTGLRAARRRLSFAPGFELVTEAHRVRLVVAERFPRDRRACLDLDGLRQ